MGHRVEGGAEWIRGRVGVRGLGTRVDLIDRIDLMDWMDWMDWMEGMDGMDGMDGIVSGVGTTRRVALGCLVRADQRGTDGRQGEGSGK